METHSGADGASTLPSSISPRLPPPIPPDALAPVAPPFRSRRELWIEVLVVIGLAVWPDTIHSIGTLIDGSESRQSATPLLQLCSIIARTVGVVVPFWLLMRRSGVDIRDFGLRRFTPLHTAIVGTVLWAAASYAPIIIMWPVYWYAAAFGFTSDGDFTQHWTPPSGVGSWACIGLVGFINGFGEEIVVRGYLITRLSGLWSSRTAAVIVTALLFGSYHLYYGWYPALHIALTGLILGAYFAATRRLWPVIFAHILGDILPFVFYSLDW